MLTERQLLALIKLQWNETLLHQHGSAQEKALLADTNFDDMANLLQDLKLYHRGLVAKEYAQQIHHNLLAACADQATAQLFLGYASTL